MDRIFSRLLWLAEQIGYLRADLKEAPILSHRRRSIKHKLYALTEEFLLLKEILDNERASNSSVYSAR